MKYEELKEKASKGPFFIQTGTDIYDNHGNYILDCYAEHDLSYENSEANAKLIAHTLNHFDKLLEAVEGVVKNSYEAGVMITEIEPYEMTEYDIMIKPLWDKLDKTLKEAKEVAQ